MRYRITINVDGQDPYESNWNGDNVPKDLHNAIVKYMRDHYKKPKAEEGELDYIKNHLCKTCGEGTITKFFLQTDKGNVVMYRCTKCGTTGLL